MSQVSALKIVKNESCEEKRGQLKLGVMDAGELRIFRYKKQVGVCYGRHCLATYEEADKFSRNHIIVQLHVSGKMKLVRLAEIFGLDDQHLSNLVQRYKRDGINGLVDRTHHGIGRRKLFTRETTELILKLNGKGMTYKEMSQVIRFRQKKKIKPSSIKTWVNKAGRVKNSEIPKQEELLPAEKKSPQVMEAEKKESDWNAYAGSMVLYGMVGRSKFLESFRGNISGEKDIGSSWDVERILLTLFFLHALRFKNIEQSKHLIGEDFRQIVGGDFLRLQWLRYGVDRIVNDKGFNEAATEHFKKMKEQVLLGDKYFYTDGHFSAYHGKRKIPKGYDARRAMPARGRNNIYLHNTKGEVMYFFESPTNTTLSNDIPMLVGDMKNLELELERRTLVFDRGGHALKTFKYLKENKMYWISYLKNRKKEREIPIEKFIELKTQDERTYKIYEKEARETRYGKVRTIIFLGNNNRQVPVLTTNPYIKSQEVVATLKNRWVEENSFKYMTEHFEIDGLTTYKIEQAPDKIIESAHPKRKEINIQIAQKKREIEKLKSELAQKLSTENKEKTLKVFYEENKATDFLIKNAEVELDQLLIQKENTPIKTTKNLKDEHVIIAQKRRLLINMVKALNYNAEKWLQDILKKYHKKEDETLSTLRQFFRLPGRIQFGEKQVTVELKRPDSGISAYSLSKLIENLKENNWLRLPDGRDLDIRLAQ
jgi:hypothetical protein